MYSGANSCLLASAEEAKSGCSCLCAVTAWNDVVDSNGLGGCVLVSGFDPENKFDANSPSSAWKKKVLIGILCWGNRHIVASSGTKSVRSHQHLLATCCLILPLALTYCGRQFCCCIFP